MEIWNVGMFSSIIMGPVPLSSSNEFYVLKCLNNIPFFSLAAARHMACAYLAPGAHLSGAGFDLSALTFSAELSPIKPTVHLKTFQINCKCRPTIKLHSKKKMT